MAEIMLSHLRKEDGYKRASIARRKKGIIHKISFQRTPKTILKHYEELYLRGSSSLLLLLSTSVIR